MRRNSLRCPRICLLRQPQGLQRLHNRTEACKTISLPKKRQVYACAVPVSYHFVENYLKSMSHFDLPLYCVLAAWVEARKSSSFAHNFLAADCPETSRGSP